MNAMHSVIHAAHLGIPQTARANPRKLLFSLTLIGSIALLGLFATITAQGSTAFFSNVLFSSINEGFAEDQTTRAAIRRLGEDSVFVIENSTIIMEMLSQLSPKLYTGQWNSDDSKEGGKMVMKIVQASRDILRASENLQVLFRLNKGITIDKWIVITSTGKINYLQPSNSSIEGNYFSKLEYGQNLDRPTSEQNCDSSIKLVFEGLNSINTTQEDNTTEQKLLFSIIKGEFKSKCNLNFSFTTEVEEIYTNYVVITVYSVIVSFLCLCSLFNSSWMIYKLDTSVVYGNSISLITVSENIIWNAYGCLCHFFLSLSFNIYSVQFGLPSFLFFLNFTIIDIRLLYKLWSLKFSSIVHDPVLLRRKLIQFYFVFYVIMFFSFFFVLKFYFDKVYVLFALLVTWIPQIVFNAYYHNKISMPIVFIVITALNRMFPSLYFRGYKHNFFDLSTDWLLVFASVVIMLMTTLFMYSQTLYGSRWFLPQRFKGSEVDLYKTEEEALQVSPLCCKAECLICLEQLFKAEKTFNFPNDFVSDAENENSQIATSANAKKKWLSDLMLDFHERSMNIHHKPYMMTPCNHLFHANCLESWFKMKKECPSCRQKIEV